jgi:hypothetical protein
MLALLAAWAAATGVDQLHHLSRFFPVGVICAILIAPALALPVLASSAATAHRSGPAALTVQVQIVLLNLCLLLPALALLWYVRPWLLSFVPLFQQLYGAPAGGAKLNPAITYPMLTWRLDPLVLVVLGVMLLPVSIGRWMLGRYEGMGLMIGYAMYLMLTVAMGVR